LKNASKVYVSYTVKKRSKNAKNEHKTIFVSHSVEKLWLF
jgi:hypothetical protein